MRLLCGCCCSCFICSVAITAPSTGAAAAAVVAVAAALFPVDAHSLTFIFPISFAWLCKMTCESLLRSNYLFGPFEGDGCGGGSGLMQSFDRFGYYSFRIGMKKKQNNDDDNDDDRRQ